MSSPEDREKPVRSRVDWVDEGSTRGGKPSARPGKASASRTRKGGRRDIRALDVVVDEFIRVLGVRASARAIKRYEAALHSFEGQRYGEAQKILVPMAREYPDVAAVHEMLGLCLYRGGTWKRAAAELERSLELAPDWIFNHAVLADCHRALGNHVRTEQLWRELADASPHPEVLAEGRIVMAGSLADRGLIDDALALMEKVSADSKKPAEYQLRQWFVIADLHDRQGNAILARRFFERVASHDAGFVDVAERLSTLGA
jgi:tetratricopeptide (TPR) repeat protein